MSEDLHQPLTSNQQVPQINENQQNEQGPYLQQPNQIPPYQQQPYQQQQQQQFYQQEQQQMYIQQPYQQQPYQDQTQNYQNQQMQRQNLPSEFRQSQQSNQFDPYQNPSQSEPGPFIKDIDQWARIAPCMMLGLSSIIVCSIFMMNCKMTTPSIFVSSGSALLIIPFLFYKFNVDSKFMNFLGFLISMYFMIVLAVYVDSQKNNVIDDDSFYQQQCLKDDKDRNSDANKGISLGAVNLLGLSMCMLHTVNMAYYLCQTWSLSKHPLKQKIEDKTIELI